MWQELREHYRPHGLELVTVGLDTAERCRRFIERAEPAHPSLVDPNHTSVAALGFVNVPSSVWVDENGVLVRPAEYAPLPPADRPTRSTPPEGIPERMRSIAEEAAKLHDDGTAYHAALADWVSKGAASRFALPPEEVVARSRPRGADTALGHAHFELATALEARGDHDRAVTHFREAHRLAPDNWTFRRRAWSLEPAPNRFWQGPDPDDPDAWPYEGDWLSDIRREGAESYYERFAP